MLISTANGDAVAYALWNLEERGPMFITPGTPVYEGMIIGAHTRGNDLDVNPIKGKQLTNIRTTAEGRSGAPDAADPDDAGAGDRLYRRRRAGRGDAEIIRLRKRFLDPNDRKRANRAAEAAAGV